jgi:hypothetical protein
VGESPVKHGDSLGEHQIAVLDPARSRPSDGVRSPSLSQILEEKTSDKPGVVIVTNAANT